MELRRIITPFIIAAALLAGCTVQPQGEPSAVPDKAPVIADPAPSQPPASATKPSAAPTEGPAPALTPEEAIRLRADAVLTALEQADPVALADLVHPVRGVRFSPYSHVRTETEGDLVFTAEELRTLEPAKVYEWGSYDGSGAPIEKSFAGYLEAFAHRKPYRSAPEVSFNQVARTGNTVNNITEAYPDGRFIEFHFPGSEQYGGADWDSLRLVFEESEGQWYLVGVINDQWTI